jgi:beta-glucanase (GH16 family)
MLGADSPEVGWPACGEIDVVELRGDQPTDALGTVHGPGYSGAASVGHTFTADEALTDGFHVYAVEWDPRVLTWFVDDEVLGTVDAGDLPADAPWVFDHPFYLLVNLAVGGTFLAPPDETTPDRAVLGVDWVRVSDRAVPLAAASTP